MLSTDTTDDALWPKTPVFKTFGVRETAGDFISCEDALMFNDSFSSNDPFKDSWGEAAWIVFAGRELDIEEPLVKPKVKRGVLVGYLSF